MENMQYLKQLIDSLPSDKKLEIGVYATSQWTIAKQKEEELALFQALPEPITENDRNFIEKNKHNKSIQWAKIKLTETAVEIDGIKFWRDVAKSRDVKNIKGVRLNKDFFEENGVCYFNRSGIQKLLKAGIKIPTIEERRKAVAVFGWSYMLLGQILNYEWSGVLHDNGQLAYVGDSVLWSSSSFDDEIYAILFNAGGAGKGYEEVLYKLDACSLVFLQD